jgi:hypothetical protein
MSRDLNLTMALGMGRLAQITIWPPADEPSRMFVGLGEP